MMSLAINEFFRKAVTLPLAALVAGATCVFAEQDEVEFSEQTEALVAATSALFEAVENAPSVDGARIRIEGLAIPARQTLEDDLSSVFLSEYGPVQHLTGYRINWYPMDRLIGAVDFMGTYDRNRGLVCGYVTWDLSDPQEPQIDHLVANYVDLTLLARRHPGATHAALLDANCAYGEIEPNFMVFDPAG